MTGLAVPSFSPGIPGEGLTGFELANCQLSYVPTCLRKSCVSIHELVVAMQHHRLCMQCKAFSHMPPLGQARQVGTRQEYLGQRPLTTAHTGQVFPCVHAYTRAALVVAYGL